MYYGGLHVAHLNPASNRVHANPIQLAYLYLDGSGNVLSNISTFKFRLVKKVKIKIEKLEIIKETESVGINVSKTRI